MKVLFLFLLFLALPVFSTAQVKMEEDIEAAFQNAKKGIYWSLDNFPDKKNRLEGDLIADDKLLAKVKLIKEINGVKIESTGYHNSNEVIIITYKSNESLFKEGYIKEKVKKEDD